MPSPLSHVGARFVGQGRQEHVDRLLAHYRALESGARTQPVVVSLEGRSGLGKSRIVQELYASIAKGQSYWPPTLVESERSINERRKALGFSASTGLRRGRDKAEGAEAPFVWLALDCDRSKTGVQTSSLLELIEELRQTFPELAGDKVARDALEEGGTFAFEKLIEGLDVVSDAVPGAGVFKTAFKLGMRAHRRRVANAEADAARVIDPHAGKGPELLGLLLALSRARRARPLPMVLVVEDAHWADPGVVEFLTALVAPREPPRLPLLVVTTAWPAGLVREETEEAVFADVLPDGRELRGSDDALRLERRPLEPLPAAGLARMIDDVAPETSREIVDAFAGHVDGNPLLLGLLLQHPRVQGSLRDGAITVSPDRIRDLPDEVQKAFGALWLALPEDVRLVLRVAAIQGRQFHRESVVAGAEAAARFLALDRDPADALQDAVAPHAWVRPWSDEVLAFFERYCFDFAHESIRQFAEDEIEAIVAAMLERINEIRSPLQGRMEVQEGGAGFPDFGLDEFLLLDERSRRQILEVHLQLARRHPALVPAGPAAESALHLATELLAGDRSGALHFLDEWLPWMRQHERPAPDGTLPSTLALEAAWAVPDRWREAAWRDQRDHVAPRLAADDPERLRILLLAEPDPAAAAAVLETAPPELIGQVAGLRFEDEVREVVARRAGDPRARWWAAVDVALGDAERYAALLDSAPDDDARAELLGRLIELLVAEGRLDEARIRLEQWPDRRRRRRNELRDAILAAQEGAGAVVAMRREAFLAATGDMIPGLRWRYAIALHEAGRHDDAVALLAAAVAAERAAGEDPHARLVQLARSQKRALRLHAAVATAREAVATADFARADALHLLLGTLRSRHDWSGAAAVIEELEAEAPAEVDAARRDLAAAVGGDLAVDDLRERLDQAHPAERHELATELLRLLELEGRDADAQALREEVGGEPPATWSLADTLDGEDPGEPGIPSRLRLLRLALNGEFETLRAELLAESEPADAVEQLELILHHRRRGAAPDLRARLEEARRAIAPDAIDRSDVPLPPPPD
jgi:hypothetical protein